MDISSGSLTDKVYPAQCFADIFQVPCFSRLVFRIENGNLNAFGEPHMTRMGVDGVMRRNHVDVQWVLELKEKFEPVLYKHVCVYISLGLLILRAKENRLPNRILVAYEGWESYVAFYVPEGHGGVDYPTIDFMRRDRLNAGATETHKDYRSMATSLVAMRY